MTLDNFAYITNILSNESLELVDKNVNLKLYKFSDKITLKCKKCDNVFEISISNILDKRRKGLVCQRCDKEKKFINALEKLYSRNPYDFLSKFTNATSPLKVRCKDCGYDFTVNNPTTQLLNQKNKHHPCLQCSFNRNYKKDISELENELIKVFGKCNYIFPEPEKSGGLHSKNKMKIICKICGHEMITHPYNILNPKNKHHYCRVCNNKDRKFEKLSYSEKCNIITSGKLQPLEPYINNKTKIMHECLVCGHKWKKLPVSSSTKRNGCPICSHLSQVSHAEDDIFNFIKSLDSSLEIQRNNRNILKSNQELDFYIPSKKLAIEFDGLYWHCDKYKDKDYHINKTRECKSLGIRLIHIFEDEWELHKEIVKNKIKNILNYNTDSNIYARKCKIENLSSKEKNIFLNKYHIQGEDRSSIYKCLKYKNEIVAVMTFVKARISLGNKNLESWELSRFATANHVIGGFSKLLNAILNEHNEIEKIITYADLRWSSEESNVYIKNNFVLEHISKPNYWYFNKDFNNLKREHRYSFRKQKLKEKFSDLYDDNLTEFQIMDKTQYRRIWDCGNLVYIKNIKRQ